MVNRHAKERPRTHRSRHPATDPGPSGPDATRRSLLGALWFALGGIALAEGIWMVVSFLKPGPSDRSSRPSEPIVDAGPVSRFTPNSVTAFPQGRFYLSRLEDGGFLALSRRCTHLGCTVPWDPETGRFACPCHASVFDIRGDVIQSPAPRPLDRFAVTIENNHIKVNIGRPIRRHAVDDSEVVYP